MHFAWSVKGGMREKTARPSGAPTLGLFPRPFERIVLP
jgi:hypothetical protein